MKLRIKTDAVSVWIEKKWLFWWLSVFESHSSRVMHFRTVSEAEIYARKNLLQSPEKVVLELESN